MPGRGLTPTATLTHGGDPRGWWGPRAGADQAPEPDRSGGAVYFGAVAASEGKAGNYVNPLTP